MRVDEQLLAGLRILDDQKAQVRQLHFQRIVEADGDDIMAARKLCERLCPTGRADEIGDDENERAPRRHAPGHLQQVREVRGIRTLDLGPRLHPVQQVQHLAPAAARGNYGVDAIAVEERSDPVAVRGKDARQHGHEIVGHREIDVGLEQRAAHLSKPLTDVGLCQPAAPAQLLQRLAQTSLDAFEHKSTRSPHEGRDARKQDIAWEESRLAANFKL